LGQGEREMFRMGVGRGGGAATKLIKDNGVKVNKASCEKNAGECSTGLREKSCERKLIELNQETIFLKAEKLAPQKNGESV